MGTVVKQSKSYFASSLIKSEPPVKLFLFGFSPRSFLFPPLFPPAVPDLKDTAESFFCIWGGSKLAVIFAAPVNSFFLREMFTMNTDT